MSETATRVRMFLDQEEIDDLCFPLTMPAAQVRYLRTALRLHVERKPSGHALLLRSEFERVHGAARVAGQAAPVVGTSPNVVGLEQWASKRKSSGQKSQGR
ncbi:MAG: hypothetical protein JWQ89_3194 [Devosia sp.]|uniref:hypothetical protein n=1 Tax=Devosia sp. TaxID=1871048 RepID=UPI0026366010|nr:hypothetical protein [Devosia sp.]MDB5541467.1 hypothetical protein [Devosia sp.]